MSLEASIHPLRSVPVEPGSVVLDDVVRFVRRFVVLTDAQADTLALWTAHTHATMAFDCTPYLAITSREKRSGKTRLLEALELIVHEGLPTANTSDAALFRSISELAPTLLLDEVDAVFKSREREDLRGLLNAGYRRGAKVRRMGGPRNTTLEVFDVFCAKAFAGIGNCLPEAITDRAITIALQQKTRDEVVERFRRRIVAPEAEILRDRLADWVEPQLAWLRAARPELPESSTTGRRTFGAAARDRGDRRRRLASTGPPRRSHPLERRRTRGQVADRAAARGRSRLSSRSQARSVFGRRT
jgi:Protein of unknown function (DUF3631)